MKDFPKWVLVIAGINLVPVLLSPLFLFGAQPFGNVKSAFGNFALYVCTQLLWVVPLLIFFISLDFYRRGYERLGVFIAFLGAVCSITGIILL